MATSEVMLTDCNPTDEVVAGAEVVEDDATAPILVEAEELEASIEDTPRLPTESDMPIGFELCPTLILAIDSGPDELVATESPAEETTSADIDKAADMEAKLPELEADASTLKGTIEDTPIDPTEIDRPMATLEDMLKIGDDDEAPCTRLWDSDIEDDSCTGADDDVSNSTTGLLLCLLLDGMAMSEDEVDAPAKEELDMAAGEELGCTLDEDGDGRAIRNALFALKVVVVVVIADFM